MRVHKSLFTQGSASKNQGIFHLGANFMQKPEGNDNVCEDDQEETISSNDAFDDESNNELAQHARSSEASLSDDGASDGYQGRGY